MKKKTIVLGVVMATLGLHAGEAAQSTDLFNLDAIYNDQFTYSLPRANLENFAKGLGLDNKVEYTPAEFELLKQDIQEIWDRIMASNPDRNGHLIVTAGAPGAGKTTLMRSLWEKGETPGGRYAYTCYDDVCLKEMRRTYGAMVKEDPSPEGQARAYNKWRAGSHLALNLINAHLVKGRFNFYFGTTCSSPMTCKFFDFVRKYGYQSITILHVTAPDQVRWDSVKGHTFTHTTSQDIINKQLMVHERIQDTILKYGNRVYFYFRPEADKDAILTSTWTPGKLDIVAPEMFKVMRDLHDKVCEGMKKPELKWANTVDKTL